MLPTQRPSPEEHNDEFDYKVFWGCDLQTEHERYLTERSSRDRYSLPTTSPKEIKAFYMKLNPDGKTVAAVDCLVPGIGEIIGGSQREDDYEKLLARMNELIKAGRLRFLPRSEKIRQCPPLRFRSRLRALRNVPYRNGQYPRRSSIPAYR